MRLLSSVLVRDHESSIRRQKNSLVVSSNGNRQRIPFEGIDSVVVFGGAHMTLDAIGACADRDIRVAVLRRGGKVRWIASTPTRGNVNLRSAQHDLSQNEAKRLEACRYIVGGKIQNSLRVVSRWRRDAEPATRSRLQHVEHRIAVSLERLESSPTDNHVRGVEGDAARSHFTAAGIVLAKGDLRFGARTRRPPLNPVNAALSFAYGLLLTECAGAIEASGLDPQIGFLHRARSGRSSLALDLMEEFRPLSDRFVISAIRRSQISVSDFEDAPGGAVYLSDTGRRRFFELWEEHKSSSWPHLHLGRDVERWALPTVQATLMARYVRGDLPVYAPFVGPR